MEDADDGTHCSSDSKSPRPSSISSASSQETDLSTNHDETEALDGSDASDDVMILEEVAAPPERVVNNEKPKFSDTSNGEKKNLESSRRSEKKKSKAEKLARMSDPDKILANVLAKSQFKVPNLSLLVEDKFNAADFPREILNELRDITYEDATLDHPKIDKSVLPDQYDLTHTVNVPPFAITMLQCMYDVPPKRDRRGKQKRKKQQQQQQEPRSNDGGVNRDDAEGSGAGPGRGRGGGNRSRGPGHKYWNRPYVTPANGEMRHEQTRVQPNTRSDPTHQRHRVYRQTRRRNPRSGE